MEDHYAGVAPIGRLGGVSWRLAGFKVMAAVLLVLALGLLISAAVTRSTTLLPMAAVAAGGAGLQWMLAGRASEHTLVYFSELVLYNRQGQYAMLPRGSVSTFRIVEHHDSAPRIVAVQFDGQEMNIAGANQPQGGWMRDAIRPLRSAKAMKAKLDHWLTTGHYPT
ncbi:hypothetical protein [Rhodococcoides yunnanense]|uniref:PH domain-containing protein n=1 Tax=Rhodococcoides yunnanense TaxID=278209 RepID=A0ABU4BII6_9NOCA|nr:hypothetical protein [Rhodococcus yunnanensis]MDV6264020.1 hypothetical protein [Rhodococcus yunnanensis]